MIGFVDINLPYDHGQTKKVPPQSKIDLRLAYKDTYNVLTLSERFLLLSIRATYLYLLSMLPVFFLIKKMTYIYKFYLFS